MTSIRTQPFCKNYNTNIGCFNGKEITPGNITERNKTLFIHKIHFCSISKSQKISFNQEIKELKPNFKVVDNVISDKHVKSYIKYEYKPKNVESPSNIIVVYVLETYNKDKAVPYCSCTYELGKISGK